MERPSITQAFSITSILLLSSCCIHDSPPPGLPAEAADLLGTYILQGEADRRVELAQGWECFATLDGGKTLLRGKWTVDGPTCSCSATGERSISIRWRIDGPDLVEDDGSLWVRRDKWAPSPWTNLSPVRFQVVDRATGRPLSRFAYTFTIADSRAEFDPLLVRPVEVQARDGTFTLRAPPSFEIVLCVVGQDIPRGYGSWKTYQVLSTDVERRVRVEVEVGVTVEGVVRDEVTKLPVEDAEVSPMIFTPPGSSDDRERSVKTDERGRFILHGVGKMGYQVSHPNYERTRATSSPSKARATVWLRRGYTICGTVKDPAGRPVGEVWLMDSSGNSATTGADGRFCIRGLRKAKTMLDVRKPGWVDQWLDSGRRSDVDIVLEPCPVLNGTVLDESGRPMSTYTIHAGPGVDPEAWQCREQRVSDDLGRFEQWIPIPPYSFEKDRGRAWIAIVASGHAPWFAGLDLWTGTKSVEVSVTRGVSVTGRVEAPPLARKSLRVRVLPTAPGNIHSVTLRQRLGTVSVPVNETGEFALPNVRPGQYVLSIFGPGITPIDREVTVPEGGLEVGTLRPVGRGTISGRAWKPRERKPWAFGEGQIVLDFPKGLGERELPHRAPIQFRTDGDGRFRVESVPVGEVHVGITQQTSACTSSIELFQANVREGNTTEVLLHEPSP